MRGTAEGRINERVDAIASVGYPGYVVRGDKATLMIDAGLNWLGPAYLSALGETLGDAAKLDYLLLTHSHYDHVGAASYLKRNLPGVKVCGHERLDTLLRKPSALELMNRLTDSHKSAREKCACEGDMSIKPMGLDMSLKEGDKLDLGGITCEVWETPGHTRDSISFHIPEIGVLFTGDACGVLEAVSERELRVEFLSSYQEYLASLERIRKSAPRTLCLAHRYVLTGDDVTRFLEQSAAETVKHRALIESYLDARDGDIDLVTEELGREEYDVRGGIGQERAAYMVNLAAQVRHIASLRP